MNHKVHNINFVYGSLNIYIYIIFIIVLINRINHTFILSTSLNIRRIQFLHNSDSLLLLLACRYLNWIYIASTLRLLVCRLDVEFLQCCIWSLYPKETSQQSSMFQQVLFTGMFNPKLFMHYSSSIVYKCSQYTVHPHLFSNDKLSSICRTQIYL